MKLVESLREGTPRIREMEKEIEKLEDNLDEQRSQVKRLTEVCSKLRVENILKRFKILNLTSIFVQQN